jgi:hypothetical protein
MKKQIIQYVESELAKLDSGEVDSVSLKGVYPDVLADRMEGWDWSEADTNGWQVDYWLTTDKYRVAGSMYYGTATISLR